MSIALPDEWSYHQTIKTFASEPEPTFESPEQQRLVWGREWGCPNDVGTLRVVLLCRPPDDLASVVDTSKWDEELHAYADREAGWYWRHKEPPDLKKMRAQHDGLAEALRNEGVQLAYVTGTVPGHIKSQSTRDQVVAVRGGAIICRMGARLRRGEEAPVTKAVAALGMPILRTVNGTGIFEGGSFAMITERTAVVGIGARANGEGARQVEEVLRTLGVELLKVELNGYKQHIDGAFVMADVNVALINPIGLPFWFLEKLKALKIRTVECHPDDPPFTVNCLAVRPGRVIMSRTSERTVERLGKAGVEVISLDYEHVYRGGGGVHCSTAPLVRDAL
jgi:N-dimethylarginine dimethylaminohydrolase